MSSGPSSGTSGSVTPSVPPTPGDENGIHFTPKRAMMSFENLVALANHQERLKEARKMVWRDKGQPVVELDTLEACLAHAMSGGFRAATLAFNIRASVNLVLALIRIPRVPKDYRFAMIRHALFGTDTWRFAAMLGTFASLYKFLINALPILIPALNPQQTPSALQDDSDESDDLEAQTGLKVPLQKRKARMSLTARAQMVLIRKQTRRWHAALAGAVAGSLAIMWETRSRRGVIAQQLFVRGLQGSWNAYTTKRNIRVPNGDVLVFSLACGQILYAWLLRPDTLPRSYSSWISQASKVPPECVRMNHDLVRDGVLNVADIDSLVRRVDITPSNKADLLALRNAFLNPLPKDASGVAPYFPLYGPCSSVHPTLSSCADVPLDRFFAVFKWMLPIYGALHFIPAVLFKRKAFVQDPAKMLIKASLGSMRSSAFLGVFVIIYQTLYCYKHHLHKFLTMLRTGARPASLLTLPLTSVPPWVTDLLISKFSFWLPGFAAGLSLFVEEKRRRGELAMYVLPKGLESIWVMARGKGWVFRTGKWGETILTALGMAMFMSTYQNDPQHLSGLVRRIMYQFIGPN
ncbi:hypothetical protein NLJ89_g8152 [Agrocybe chaxingu]|uniref:Transmembrane protein 135 N-terminal domain-containing protein n=1 Tax=Agrocybe chaxingu TaxID=84603 RepID=A0A9W8MT07_9AGAR|nr:hypothetical protein NLJ89_g8152 [Agrocybe chaxingu]